ncbi:MAG: DUF1722 domain-containing protein [Filifactor alocis]|nr:DUF1722 domain-containing protein [Filifactor alocis]
MNTLNQTGYACMNPDVSPSSFTTCRLSNFDHKVHTFRLSKGDFELLQLVTETWKKGQRPKMHYSQQAEGKQSGVHSSTIDLYKFAEDYQHAYRYFDLDIMLKVKDKNRSFKKVDAFLNPSRRKLEEEWAAYKYLVMSKSYGDYTKIRHMFGNGREISAIDFYHAVDICLQKETSSKNLLNTFEHIRGYFKKSADRQEKALLHKQIEGFRHSVYTERTVGKSLWRLAKKYDQTYLLNSYFLKQYI